MAAPRSPPARHGAATSPRTPAPTLVVSGEEPLDRVVPVRSTRRYAELIPRADYRILPQTGHMAILTRPSQFAGVVSDFAHAHHH